jgi:uncharacterized protein YecE (DUF72 family)
MNFGSTPDFSRITGHLEYWNPPVQKSPLYSLAVTASVHLGTSSFTATGWDGSFYPAGIKPRNYLSFYAEHFDSVEVDSTFYACPSVNTVKGWFTRTPDNFIFSAKAPQTITHDKVLVDCESELKEFLDTMGLLGTKLGPIVFQFPFFSRGIFRDRHEFLDRLVPFLEKLPANQKFAIEPRNKNWLDAEFANLLRDHGIALVLQDRSWMPNPSELKFDPITADWTYIRWLGDRKGIEAMTQTWDKVVVDRTEELSSWVDFCYQIKKRGVTVYGYANNHYQGHAPATIKDFIGLWNEKGFPEIGKKAVQRKPVPDVHHRLFE